MEQYWANGKLLLSGEYFVMDGATALVFPVRMGQNLEVTEIRNLNNGHIEWKAFERKKEWFSAKIGIPDFVILETSDETIAHRLIKIFTSLVLLNPSLFKRRNTLLFNSNLNFKREWGLGSSSTLISNLATWAKVDPMDLFIKVSDGSGYDVAAAARKQSFLYSRRKKAINIKPVSLSANITPYLYFVYTGKKQESESSIAEYRKLQPPDIRQLKRISDLSIGLSVTEDIVHFKDMIQEHEKILANHLGRIPVKEILFPDFPGVVKSLGAWGGDFLLFVHTGIRNELEEYLLEKGHNTYFHYDEMICN